LAISPSRCGKGLLALMTTFPLSELPRLDAEGDRHTT
jgi:hypothetical protein